MMDYDKYEKAKNLEYEKHEAKSAYIALTEKVIENLILEHNKHDRTVLPNEFIHSTVKSEIVEAGIEAMIQKAKEIYNEKSLEFEKL
jgi:hypothetical protein